MLTLNLLTGTFEEAYYRNDCSSEQYGKRQQQKEELMDYDFKENQIKSKRVRFHRAGWMCGVYGLCWRMESVT